MKSQITVSRVTFRATREEEPGYTVINFGNFLVLSEFVHFQHVDEIISLLINRCKIKYIN